METSLNHTVLYNEINWLEQVIEQVICTYLLQDGHEKNWEDIDVPDLTEYNTPYTEWAIKHALSRYERLALALTLAVHLKPEALDILFGKNQLYDRHFTEFGGVTDKSHSGFLPTGQTLLFLLCANKPSNYNAAMHVLSKKCILLHNEVLVLNETENHIPTYNGLLCLTKNWFHYFVTGNYLPYENSDSFPAKRIETTLNWEDVVLDPLTAAQINELMTWLLHGETLLNEWGLATKIKRGYRALFYGPPGTGKTLTATLIGKITHREVYRIDLSQLVSKYIGETEKNLSKVFDIAENKNWILFFDEADALFGKRTATNSSNDRHANQQTAHLLQRIEDYSGTVILASNLKGNMDDAFTRRFQSIVHFNMPSVEERYQLWKNAFSGKCRLHESIDVYTLAEEFELSGGSIINVLRTCALTAIQQNKNIVEKNELLAAIKKEFKKENRTLNTQTL